MTRIQRLTDHHHHHQLGLLRRTQGYCSITSIFNIVLSWIIISQHLEAKKRGKTQSKVRTDVKILVQEWSIATQRQARHMQNRHEKEKETKDDSEAKTCHRLAFNVQSSPLAYGLGCVGDCNCAVGRRS